MTIIHRSLPRLQGYWPSRRRQISSRHYLTPANGRQPPDERLRILFCGGDVFGIPSLRVLHEEATSVDSNILSIDVVTKKDRRIGRGRKNIYTPPMTDVAKELGIRCHRIDTFTGWSPPEYATKESPYINLVVAVSFGLMIPPRILKQSTYGGLNLHPSMLPELRGAAPIQWSIMNGLTYTGLSIQTLHPTEFDAGVVVAQTPSPGIAVPNPTVIQHFEFRDFLAPIGAEMLVNAIRCRLYKPPYEDVTGKNGREMSFAPKPTNSMREADFSGAERLLRRNRAIPNLWAIAESSVNGKTKKLRVVFGSDLHLAATSDLPLDITEATGKLGPGTPYCVMKEGEDICAERLLRRNRAIPNLWAIAESSVNGKTKKLRVVFGSDLHLAATSDLPLDVTEATGKLGPGTPYCVMKEGEDIYESSSPLYINTWDKFTLCVPTLLVEGSPFQPASSSAARGHLLMEPWEVSGFKIYRFHQPLQKKSQAENVA